MNHPKGISGSETADTKAKKVTTTGTPRFDEPLIPQGFKKLINKVNLHSWNNLWSNTNTKLHLVRNNIWDTTDLGSNRKDQNTITRLRIGHTRATHEHLMNNTNLPVCEH